ncbi:hypothetical protein [Pseudomonas sp. zfem002]|uniref:hypothetical protein n=1 Tax=Pseudomonas sp. zfem002 TaxID=3078197 RepID=UPI00292A2292|nr:hypothetical protein [Pseudomonas sp. zfem002]MDU9393207.1 hypothetical protein [Pseudomonas sp. zfem002]
MILTEDDRMELLEQISSLVSSKVFQGVTPQMTVDGYRERCDEYGLLMGRITAVVLAESIDTDLLFSIRELTARTQQSAWAQLRSTIKPGGEISRILSDSARKPLG